jgi:hypothetical protein
MNDPVVKDLNSWINRSSGQHKRRISEGTGSAKRILKETTMTNDQFCLHRVDSSQLGPRDGVSVGYCRTDIEFAGPEPEFFNEVKQLKREGQAAFVIVMMILALIVIAFYSFTA